MLLTEHMFACLAHAGHLNTEQDSSLYSWKRGPSSTCKPQGNGLLLFVEQFQLVLIFEKAACRTHFWFWISIVLKQTLALAACQGFTIHATPSCGSFVSAS